MHYVFACAMPLHRMERHCSFDKISLVFQDPAHLSHPPRSLFLGIPSHCPVKGRNPSPSPVFLMYLVHTTLWLTTLWHFHFIFCVCLPNYYEFFEARRMSYLLLCLQGLAQYLTQSKRERKEAKTYWETALEEKWVETGGNLSLLTSQHFQEEGSDAPI